jgi:lysyl-tRNA synthetase, class I
MGWLDTVLEQVDPNTPQVVNDSKTPSGRVHVGALRGVLIHDAIFRTLRSRDISARYLFGVDDYDPLDEIPAGEDEHFRRYLGMPLCNVPAPRDALASNMADYYIGEFFDIFKEIGVEAERYHMRDVYQSGLLNETIDRVLAHADIVRDVYAAVSNSQRPSDWIPFQAVCENCGRIGTTRAVAYDGREVAYQCRIDAVTWARGCGYHGSVSPFDGHGKLPWKLEWVAKWASFPVTIEGAGKDHSTRGGSRDVAEACLRKILHRTPPLNVPYEFFLVGGAKMSSSRGLGASAREVADLLPPEILRFLILRSQPKATVNFSLDQEFIGRLFNDYDRLAARVHGGQATPEEVQLFQLCEVRNRRPSYNENFQVMLTLAQMPHLNVEQEVEKRKGSPLSEDDVLVLKERLHTGRLWLARYASDEDRLVLQDQLPADSASLTSAQRVFLHQLADELSTVQWTESAIHNAVFDVARLVPIASHVAFQAVYRVFLDRNSGPKAAALLAFLDKKFVLERLREVTFSITAFWSETQISEGELRRFLNIEGHQIAGVSARPSLFIVEVRPPAVGDGDTFAAGMGVVELTVRLHNGRRTLHRLQMGFLEGYDLDPLQDSLLMEDAAREDIAELLSPYGITVEWSSVRLRSETVIRL